MGGGKMQPGMKPTEMVRAAGGHEDLRCETVLSEMKTRLGARPFALWFENKVRLEIHGEQLVIAVGSPFLLNCIQRQFRRDLTAVAQAVLGAAGVFQLVVDASLALGGDSSSMKQGTGPQATGGRAGKRTSSSAEADAACDSPAVEELTSGSGKGRGPALRERSASPTDSRPVSGNRQRRLADLVDFVPSQVTELALAACKQVVTRPGTQFNPLFLYGSVGTGKTHLLEGIAKQLRRAQPQMQVALLTAEAFANYFTQALTERSLPAFRQKFRNVDLLLVDDVDFFESKRVFQEEFLHTLGDLADHGRQVVVTADRHPRLLTKLSEELVSRFQSGLICRLESPDLGTRQEIVARKARKLEGEFAPEALQYVAERFTGNVRELEGALNCLQTFYSLGRKKITAAVARQVLADLERDCLKVVRLADIERVVCQVFGVKSKDLKSNSRVRTLAQPRMLAMFLARKHTQSAYSEIGQHFGGRNHSTVMSAERKVRKWLTDNTPVRVASQHWTFQEIVSNLEQQLLAG